MTSFFVKHAPIHRHHWTEMRELFASLSLQAFGFTMIKLFMPILLLTKGISLEHVALYFVFWSAVQIPAHHIIVWLVHIIGVKHCLALSYVGSVISFAMLGLGGIGVQFMLAVLAINAFANSLYWDSRHVHSANILPKKSTGKSVSIVFILVLIATALGPLAGGYIGQAYGLKATILVASAIILVATIPLFMSKDHYFRVKKARKTIKTPKKHLVANSALNFESGVAESLWPLFIFFVVGSLSSLGLIVSLGLIITIVITSIVGPLTDKGFGGAFVRAASVGRTLVHTLRLGVTTLLGAFMVNLAGEIASSFKSTPYTAFFYAHARRQGIQRYIRNMQVVASVSHMVMWFVLFAALQVFDRHYALLTVFICAAAVAPLQMLIVKK